MKKILTALLITSIFSFSAAYANDAGVRSKIRSYSKKATVSKKAVTQPVVDGQTSTLYQCELGNKLTVYRNDNDDGYINLRWQNRFYRLDRQETTTGAERFSNEKNGLVLISIPSKSMLFDSKKGRQLANECKSSAQLASSE